MVASREALGEKQLLKSGWISLFSHLLVLKILLLPQQLVCIKCHLPGNIRCINLPLQLF